MLEGVNVQIDNGRGDLEYLTAQASLPVYFPVTVTKADGSVYQGLGQITGEYGAQTASATAPVNFSGTGKMTRQ